MSEYSVPLRNSLFEYNRKDKYTDAYFNTNFYKDKGVIRRQVHGNQDDDGCISPKDRVIELYNVLHYFLNKNHIKDKELIGYKKKVYQFDTDTHCLCGQNSQLFLCTHIESEKTFYMGSECIKRFQHDFIPEGANGLCVICQEHLRLKANKKIRKVKNYDGNCKKICLCCLKNKKDSAIKSKIFNIVKTNYKKARKKLEEEANEKKRQEKAIKILTLLRKQTNDMLTRHIKRSC